MTRDELTALIKLKAKKHGVRSLTIEFMDFPTLRLMAPDMSAGFVNEVEKCIPVDVRFFINKDSLGRML